MRRSSAIQTFSALIALFFMVVAALPRAASAQSERFWDDGDLSESSSTSTCTVKYTIASTTVWRQYIPVTPCTTSSCFNTRTSTDGVTWGTTSSISGIPANHLRFQLGYGYDNGRYLNPACTMRGSNIYLMYEERWEYTSGGSSYTTSVFHAATATPLSPTSFTAISGSGTFGSVMAPGSGDGDLITEPSIDATGSSDMSIVYIGTPSGTRTLRSAVSTTSGTSWTSKSTVALSGNLDVNGTVSVSGAYIADPHLRRAGTSWDVNFSASSNASSTASQTRIYLASGTATSGSPLTAATLQAGGPVIEPTTSGHCQGTADLVSDGLGGYFLYFSEESTSCDAETGFERRMATSYTFAPPSFTAWTSGPLDLSSYGLLWAIPVYVEASGSDPAEVVVSTEESGYLNLLTLDTDLTVTDDVSPVISPDSFADPACDGSTTYPDQGKVADHKHVYEDGKHYIVYSNAGTSHTGGCLAMYITPRDFDISDSSNNTIVTGGAPTNDMMMGAYGAHLYVGDYATGLGGYYTGHEVHKFDPSTSLISTTYTIGDSTSTQHGNGAAITFVDDEYAMLAPQNLDPDGSCALYTLSGPADFSSAPTRSVIVSTGTSPPCTGGSLNIASALTWIPGAEVYVGHYTLVTATTTSGGITTATAADLYRVVLDQHLRLTTAPVAIVTSPLTGGSVYNRPHTTLGEGEGSGGADRLYLGYDTSNGGVPYLTYYDVSY